MIRDHKTRHATLSTSAPIGGADLEDQAVPRIAISSKPIMVALAAALRSIDLNLATDPETVTDADRRRALKSAKRAEISLQDLVENIEKFEQDFTTAEAKTPKKKLLAEIERVIQSDPENFDKIAKAVIDVARRDTSEQVDQDRPRNSVEESTSQTSAEPIQATSHPRNAADTAAGQRENGRNFAVNVVRAPRRRQKPIDPIVAERQRQND